MTGMRTVLLSNLCNVFLVIEGTFPNQTYRITIEKDQETLGDIPLTNEQVAILTSNLASLMEQGQS